jgi:hypothetical protein
MIGIPGQRGPAGVAGAAGVAGGAIWPCSTAQGWNSSAVPYTVLGPHTGVQGVSFVSYTVGLTLFPFMLMRTATLDRLKVNITTADAGSTVRLGLYTSDSHGMPSTLLLDGGTIDSSTTGAKEVTVNQQLTGGVLYFSASLPSSTAVVGWGWQAVSALPVPYYQSGSVGYFLRNASASGALPSSPTPTGMLGISVPWVMGRFSA